MRDENAEQTCTRDIVSVFLLAQSLVFVPHNVLSAASRPSLHRLRGRETTFECQLHHDSTILLHFTCRPNYHNHLHSGATWNKYLIIIGPNYCSLCSKRMVPKHSKYYYIFFNVNNKYKNVGSLNIF